MTDHRPYMKRALELAENGRYSVSPNPLVGAVLVRDGRIISEGWHTRAGEAHAEIEALRAVEEDPRGTTLYVTLEPCCHHGRTPPCTSAVIEAGIAEVVIATEDPSPHVGGKGIEALSAAGINVVRDICRAEAERQNETFLHSASHLTPFVLLKAGMTLDGKLATTTGSSRWITSPESRDRSLRLREEYDAILVGAGTVMADNPRLTRRLGLNTSIRPWIRVVVDADGEISTDANLFNDDNPTLIYTTKPERYHSPGATEAVEMVRGPDGLDLTRVLQDLRNREIRSVVVEGGSMVLTSMIRGRLWQKMQIFVAPMVIGGAAAPSIFGGDGIDDLSRAHRLRFDAIERISSDLLITAYPE